MALTKVSQPMSSTPSIDDNGTATALTIDSSGNVGIGTSTDAGFPLTVQADSNSASIGIKGRVSDGIGSLTFDTYDGVGEHGYIQGRTTDLRIYASSSRALIFGAGNAECMRIDSSGLVGIGTSSPTAIGANYGTLEINGTAGSGIRLDFAGTTKGVVYGNSGGLSLSGEGATNINFYTNSAERMRIDSSGNLLIGKTSAANSGAGLWLSKQAVEGGRINITRGTNTSTHYHVAFYTYAGTNVGSITTTTTSTNYVTTSDQRLKENIVEAPSASDDIDAIQVRSFDWKADGSHQKYGMIAQELVEVAPEAVSQPEDSEQMMGVDYSKLVPMLVKEIQSLRQRVAHLEGE